MLPMLGCASMPSTSGRAAPLHVSEVRRSLDYRISRRSPVRTKLPCTASHNDRANVPELHQTQSDTSTQHLLAMLREKTHGKRTSEGCTSLAVAWAFVSIYLLY